MKSIINKIVFLMMVVSLLISCHEKKEEIRQDVFILAESFHVATDTVLKIMLINRTNKNYFITLDTNRVYGYGKFNHEINNSIILKPLLYENNKRIYPKLEGAVYKVESINKSEEDWVKKEFAKSDAFMKGYVVLKNALFLKKKSAKYLELPFKLKYPHTYNLTNYYDLEKGKKYDLRLEYQMVKTTTQKNVSKRKLDSLLKLGHSPYYEKIVSNKVPLITE